MAQSDKSPQAGDILLREWAHTRGPLFEDPRLLACRFFAVILAGTACEEVSDAGLRIRAARVLEEALAQVPDSNNPATREKFARASALIVDIRRLTRAHLHALSRGEPSQFSLELRERLHREVGRERESSEAEFLRTMALSELLAVALGCEDAHVQLRATRALLARTRDAARRVGRERSQAEDRAQTPEDAGDKKMPKPQAPAMPPPPAGSASPAAPVYECRGTSPP